MAPSKVIYSSFPALSSWPRIPLPNRLRASTGAETSCQFSVLICPKTAGIGAQTALKLIQKHGNLSTVLDNLDSTKYPLPEPFPYDTAQQLFAGELRAVLHDLSLCPPRVRSAALFWRSEQNVRCPYCKHNWQGSERADRQWALQSYTCNLYKCEVVLPSSILKKQGQHPIFERLIPLFVPLRPCAFEGPETK